MRVKQRIYTDRIKIVGVLTLQASTVICIAETMSATTVPVRREFGVKVREFVNDGLRWHCGSNCITIQNSNVKYLYSESAVVPLYPRYIAWM